MAIFTAIGTALGAGAGAALATGAAVAGAGLSVVGTLGSLSAQRKQAALANQQARLERRRSTMQNIRKAQITRARALMSAEGAGSSGSSGAFGGIGAVGSQLGGALGFASQSSGIQTAYNAQGQRAANFGAIGSIGSSLFSSGAKAGGLSFLSRGTQNTTQGMGSLDYMEQPQGMRYSLTAGNLY